MDKVQAFRVEVQIRLNELAAMLAPGMQVAFVACNPAKPGADIFIFSGDPADVRDAVIRRLVPNESGQRLPEWPHPDGFAGGVDRET